MHYKRVSSSPSYEISDLNIQIATAAEEQSAAAAQIKNSLDNISHIAHTTNENAQKTTEANDNIAKRLVELYVNLNQFQL